MSRNPGQITKEPNEVYSTTVITYLVHSKAIFHKVVRHCGPQPWSITELLSYAPAGPVPIYTPCPGPRPGFTPSPRDIMRFQDIRYRYKKINLLYKQAL